MLYVSCTKTIKGCIVSLCSHSANRKNIVGIHIPHFSICTWIPSSNRCQFGCTFVKYDEGHRYSSIALGSVLQPESPIYSLFLNYLNFDVLTTDPTIEKAGWKCSMNWTGVQLQILFHIIQNTHLKSDV